MANVYVYLYSSAQIYVYVRIDIKVYELDNEKILIFPEVNSWHTEKHLEYSNKSKEFVSICFSINKSFTK